MLGEGALTSKERNGASKEASEADVKASVDQTRGEAIGDSVLHQGTLNHVQNRHSVHLQHNMQTLRAALLCPILSAKHTTACSEAECC